MKLSFVFPVVNKGNISDFWESFRNSPFFVNAQDYEAIFVVSRTDSVNINYLSEALKKDSGIKVILMNDSFVYNRAFREALPFITGGVVLLGDIGIDNNDQIFADLMKEHESGADVVQVKIRRRGFSGFVCRCVGGAYNFFVRMFSENKDILNLPSLGLIDREVIEIFKVLPLKANFLRNAYYLEGIEMRTMYIDRAPVYKNNFNIKTGGLIAAYILGGVTVLCALALILTNVLLVPPVILNIMLSLILLVSFLSVFVALSKHVLDVRCDNIYFETKMVSTINTEERPESDIKVTKGSGAKPRTKGKAKTGGSGIKTKNKAKK